MLPSFSRKTLPNFPKKMLPSFFRNSLPKKDVSLKKCFPEKDMN
jgi:hypothetical protein